MTIKRKQDGFTLIEVIVTVVVMGIALLPLSAIFNMALSQTSQTEEQLKANQLAQQYIELVKAESGFKLESEAKFKITPDGIVFETIKSDEDKAAIEALQLTAKGVDGYYAEVEISPLKMQDSEETEEADETQMPHLELTFNENGRHCLTGYKKNGTTYLREERSFGNGITPSTIGLTIQYEENKAEPGLTDLECSIKDNSEQSLLTYKLEGIDFSESPVIKITNHIAQSTDTLSKANITVNVSNKTLNTLVMELYTSSTSQTVINLQDGMLIKKYNPIKSEKNSYMIYKISTEIFKEENGRSLASLETTKIP